MSDDQRHVRPVTAAGPERPSRVLVWALRALIVAAFLGGWQLCSSSAEHWQFVFSAPHAVASQLWTWLRSGSFYSQVETTLQEAALGYALGTAVALALVAIVMASSVVDRFLRPFITFVAVVPKLAISPLYLVWFGISLRSKVYFVATAIFVIAFQGIYTGLKATDRRILDNMKTLGANWGERLWHAYLPAIVSWIMTSLRVSASWALLAAVISEYLGSVKGLGTIISAGEANLDSTAVIAGIFVVAVIGLVCDRVLVLIEHHFSSWKL